MAGVVVQLSEAEVRDDFRRMEVLELGGVGTRLFCEPNQPLCPLQITVVIRGNVGNEVRRVAETDRSAVDVKIHPLPLTDE